MSSLQRLTTVAGHLTTNAHEPQDINILSGESYAKQTGKSLKEQVSFPREKDI